VSALLSFLIVASINFLLGELAIFTNALFGLMIIKNITLAFFSGSLLPSSFFPEWMNVILRFLPFQSMVEKPIMLLMGRIDGIEILYTIGIQGLWVVILSIFCNLTFNSLKKHVVSVGG
jgi:ABC-2 type transport system permease protein